MARGFDLKAFVNAWNTHDPDRIAEFYSEDAEIYVPPDKEPYRGRAGVRENVKDVMGGMEDVNGDVEWSVQDERHVTALVHISGRHGGDMPVSSERIIPATNKNVRFLAGLFLELDDQGLIKREIDLVDNLGLLQQVGAMPAASGAEATSKSPTILGP